MPDIKFRNAVQTIISGILAVVFTVCSSYIAIPAINLPMPLLFIGLFTGLAVLSFISYPKASTGQVIKLCIIGLFLNLAIIGAGIFTASWLKISQITMDSDFILLINPAIPTIRFIFSYVTMISLITFEEKKQEIKQKPAATKVKEEEQEKITFETKSKLQQEIKENIQPTKEETNAPKTTYEELYPKAAKPEKKEEPAQEIFLDFSEKTEEIKQKPAALPSEEEFIELDTLPISTLEEQKDEQPLEPKEKQEEAQENFNYIPTDIRLVEAPVSKENENKGKIGSIGKLLVNNRDIEGIIELNAEQSSGEGKTNVVSSESGEEFYEKFSKLKQEFGQIKEIALVDKGGFVLANNFEEENRMKIPITGALIAGAYHTMQNYLLQLSILDPQKIFFETENSNNFMIKTGDHFLYSVWEKTYTHVDFGSLEGFLENDELSENELIPLIELEQLQNYALSDSTGQILNTTHKFPFSENLGIISSALFENLKVFLMNINLLKLKRIVIFSNENVMTIQKFDDKIAAFITPVDGLVKLSEDFQKIENIY